MNYKKLYEKTHELCAGLKIARTYEFAVKFSECVNELKKYFTKNDLNNVSSVQEFNRELEKAIFPVQMTPAEGSVITGLYAKLKGVKMLY